MFHFAVSLFLIFLPFALVVIDIVVMIIISERISRSKGSSIAAAVFGLNFVFLLSLTIALVISPYGESYVSFIESIGNSSGLNTLEQN